MTRARWWLCLYVLLCGSAPAQQVLEAGRVEVTHSSSRVAVAVPQEDGTLLVGGDISAVDGQLREGIARLTSDGRLDPAFDADCRGREVASRYVACQVHRIVPDGTGHLIVSGLFHSVGGLPRPGLARIDATTGAVDPAWNPLAGQPSHDEYSIAFALLSDGIVVFHPLESNVLRKYSLAGAGAAVSGFLAQVSADWLLVADRQDRIYVNILGSRGVGMYRLSPATGALDPNYFVAVTAREMAFDPASDSVIIAAAHDSATRYFRLRAGSSASLELLLATDGTIYPTSSFALDRQGRLAVKAVGPEPTDFRIVTLSTIDNSVTGVAAAPEYSYPYLLALDRSGRALAWSNNPSYQEAVPNDAPLFRLSAQAQLDQTFRPRVAKFGVVHDVAVDAQGRIVLAGRFTHVNGVRRWGIARLNRDLSLDRSFVPPGIGQERRRFEAIAVDANGDVFAASGLDLTTFILRKFDGATGARDLAWVGSNATRAGQARTLDLRVDDDFLYIGGDFPSAPTCGALRSHLARVSLASPCAIDAAWPATTDLGVGRAVPLPGGGLALAGRFSQVNGQLRRGLARLDASGALDAGWALYAQTASAAELHDLLPYGDDFIVAGHMAHGATATIDGLARLDAASGTLDLGWRPAPAARYEALAVDGEQLLALRVGAAGAGSDTPRHLVRIPLVGDGAEDPTWTPLAVDAGLVHGMQALDTDAVLVWGGFLRLGGEGTGGWALIGTRELRLFASGFE